MSKIEEISYLKLLQGRTGNGLDSDIKINCGLFNIEEEKSKVLNSKIIINPQGMSDEKKATKVLKEILKNTTITNEIENIIVKVIEEEIIKKIRKLQEKVREIIGIESKKEINQGEQENRTEGGVDYEIVN